MELPGEKYEWKSYWEIEISTNTDKEGWEYAKSFDDDVWKNDDKDSSVEEGNGLNILG